MEEGGRIRVRYTRYTYIYNRAVRGYSLGTLHVYWSRDILGIESLVADKPFQPSLGGGWSDKALYTARPRIRSTRSSATELRRCSTIFRGAPRRSDVQMRWRSLPPTLRTFAAIILHRLTPSSSTIPNPRFSLLHVCMYARARQIILIRADTAPKGIRRAGHVILLVSQRPEPRLPRCCWSWC